MKKILILLVVLGLGVAAFLRLFNLTGWPPSPYWEEVVNGYDAYSLLKTGRDHHGHLWPIVALESYGDWKPALYAYSIMPFIQIFGLGTLAVRLPSAIAGAFMVGGIGWLAHSLCRSLRLTSSAKNRQSLWPWLPAVTIMVAAISPWLLMFSRGGWETNLAVALMTWAMAIGFWSSHRLAQTARSKPSWLMFGSWLVVGLLLALSMYAYHAARIVAPLLGLGLIGVWFWEFRSSQKQQSLILTSRSFAQLYWRLLLGLAVITGLILWPLMSNLRSPEVSQRFSETSIFHDLEGERERALQASVSDPDLTLVFTNRYVLAGEKVLTNFLLHFDFEYLFVSGDSNARHSTQYVGQLYHIELIFLLLGMYVTVKHRHIYFAFLWFWLVMGILPASITAAAPHALRTLIVAPVMLLFVSLGILEMMQLVSDGLVKNVAWLRSKRPLVVGLLLIAVVGVYCLEFLMFWRFYTQIYPLERGSDWQYGYEELVTKLEQQRQLQPDLPIMISREFGRPVMYVLFYTQADPNLVQEQAKIVPQDQGELLQYQNYVFVRGIEDIPIIPAMVAIPSIKVEAFQKRGVSTETLATVKDLAGKDLWHILKLK